MLQTMSFYFLHSTKIKVLRWFQTAPILCKHQQASLRIVCDNIAINTFYTQTKHQQQDAIARECLQTFCSF